MERPLPRRSSPSLRPDSPSPRSSEHTGLFPLVLNFQDDNDAGYALAHISSALDLTAFTICVHVLSEHGEMNTILSCTSDEHENEISLSVHSKDFGLWIGNEFINLPHSFKSQDWINYCVTWSSHSGGAELWINGMVGEQRNLRRGYSVSLRECVLGKDQDGVLGVTNSNGFLGKMTDVNMWNYVLSTADIRDQMLCEENSTAVGNVLSWGTTRLGFYGGLELDGHYRCS